MIFFIRKKSHSAKKHEGRPIKLAKRFSQARKSRRMPKEAVGLLHTIFEKTFVCPTGLKN